MLEGLSNNLRGQMTPKVVHSSPDLPRPGQTSSEWTLANPQHAEWERRARAPSEQRADTHRRHTQQCRQGGEQRQHGTGTWSEEAAGRAGGQEHTGQGLCSLWVCLVRSHRPELKYEDVPPASSDRLDAVVLVADKDQGVAKPEGVSGK